MNRSIEKVAILQAILAFILFITWIIIGDLKHDSTELRNELNQANAKISSLEEIDKKVYEHLDTLGGNDLMIQSWIDEIQCMLMDCRNEWRN